MNKYTIDGKKGINDLKSIYAFHGNSQGDTSVSNNIEDYKNSKGWMSFHFDCELTEEAIIKESNIRKEWNESYIKELQSNGTYGEVYHLEVSIDNHPLLDDPNKPLLFYPLESYKLVFLDLSTE